MQREKIKIKKIVNKFAQNNKLGITFIFIFVNKLKIKRYGKRD